MSRDEATIQALIESLDRIRKEVEETKAIAERIRRDVARAVIGDIAWPENGVRKGESQ